MDRHEIQVLLRHMEWADALTWKAVLNLPPAHRDAVLRERLYHLHSVQWAYLHIWRGEKVRPPKLAGFADLRAIGVWAQAYYRELAPVLPPVEDSSLSREVALPWAHQVARRFGAAVPVTLGETVLQVLLHSTYHRGQIAARTRELGGEPPLTDFLAWVWMQRPDPQWERHDAA